MLIYDIIWMQKWLYSQKVVGGANVGKPGDLAQ